MIKRLTFFTVYLFCVNAHSESFFNKLWYNYLPPSDTLIETFDTNYINPLLDQVTIRYYSNLKTNDIIFKHGKNLDLYRANTLVKYGVSVGYRWFIFNWAFLSPHGYYQEKERGQTKAFDIQMNIVGYRWLFDFRWLNYDGYYLENTVNVIDDWEDTNLELQLNELNNFSIGGNFRYQLNRKAYSFKAAFDQTQHQKKSAGTAFVGASYGFGALSSAKDSVFILSDNTVFESTNFDALSFGLGGGFAQTFVLKENWFFTLSAELYYQTSFTLDYDKGVLDDIFTTPTGIIRTAVGFNSDKNYLGITGLVDFHPYVQNNHVQVFHSFSNIRLVYARRFTVSKLPFFKSTAK